MPFLTPLKVGWVVAERYFYLGLAGIMASVSILISNIFARFDIKYLYLGLAAIALAFGARTVERNMDWQSADKLWVATAVSSPSDPKTHNNLGDVFSRAGDYESAEQEFKKAVDLNSNYADAYHNLGLTQYQMGKTDEAISNFKEALQIRPYLWQSYAQLAQIYYEKEDYAKALVEVEKALQIVPDNQNLLQAQELLQSELQ